MSRSSFSLGVALIAVAAATAPGCLKRQPPAKRAYLLEVERGSDPATDAPDTILYVRRVHVSPVFEGKSFIYRRSDGTWEADFYNEFFALPSYQFTEALRRWLSADAGGESLVVGAAGLAWATHALASRVSAFYGDYTTAPPRAVIEMEFDLLAVEDGGEITPILHRKYRQDPPARDGTPDALVDAWSDGIRRILGDLERDVVAALR
jgi:uncharacterized lipoprotein YmbA